MNELNEDSSKLLKSNLQMVVLYGELLLDRYFSSANKEQPLSGW